MPGTLVYDRISYLHYHNTNKILTPFWQRDYDSSEKMLQMSRFVKFEGQAEIGEVQFNLYSTQSVKVYSRYPDSIVMGLAKIGGLLALFKISLFFQALYLQKRIFMYLDINFQSKQEIPPYLKRFENKFKFPSELVLTKQDDKTPNSSFQGDINFTVRDSTTQDSDEKLIKEEGEKLKFSDVFTYDNFLILLVENQKMKRDINSYFIIVVFIQDIEDLKRGTVCGIQGDKSAEENKLLRDRVERLERLIKQTK